MDISTIFLENRLLIHTIYILIVIACCAIISIKFRRMYSLSTYKGFRFFSNAFIFYALGLFLTYFMDWGPTYIYEGLVGIMPVLKLVMEYALVMGGFFLVYSLLWKKLEEVEISVDRVILLHVVALAIAIIDYYKTTGYVMYVVLLVVTVYACFLTYNNYVSSKSSKNGFKGLFFLAMVLNFIGWLAYFAAFFVYPFYPAILAYIYIVTAAIFVIFLYGVLKVK